MSEVSTTFEQSYGLSWRALSGSKLWSVATVFLCISLWAQLFAVAFLAETQFVTPRPHAILSYLAPLVLMAAGVCRRVPVLLLTCVPVGLVPGLLLLPEQELFLLLEGASMLRVGATMTLYLAVASAGTKFLWPTGEIEHLEKSASAGIDASIDLKRFVWARIGVLTVLFLVPTFGVFQDPEIASALSLHYEEAAPEARVFLSLMHFFSWSVGVYMMVLLPALNLEYDYKKTGRVFDSKVEALSMRSSYLKIVVLLIFLVALLVGYLFLNA